MEGFAEDGFTVDGLIKALEAIRAKHGGDTKVYNGVLYNDDDTLEPVTECFYSMAGSVTLG